MSQKAVWGRENVFFKAKGYGRAQMIWHGFKKGSYIVQFTDGKILDRKKIEVKDDQILKLNLPLEGHNCLFIQIKEE